jgi:hypothetical protein
MSDITYQMVIKQLAEQWQLNDRQSRCLQALDSAAVAELLKIDTTLHQLFAGSPLLADLWMTCHNRAFDNASPMELIEREGMAGLKRVVQFLCLED